jgi:chromosome segregation ATPase
MKKLIFTLSATIMLTGVIFTSCNTAAEKVDNAEEKSIKADEDFNSAKEEYLADIENFKKETNAKIDANNLTIADFKVKIATSKKDAQVYYQEQIAILEQKNIAMKEKMDAYQESGKDNWESFKTEFNKDMNDLGEAFKNFTVKNE